MAKSKSFGAKILEALGIGKDASPDAVTRVRSGVEIQTTSGVDRIFGSLGSLNPAEYNRSVSARQSHADALGIVFGQDRDLYDLYAEMRDKDPVIAGCIAHLGAVVEEFPSDFAPVDSDDEEAAEAAELAREQFEAARGWRDALAAWGKGAMVDGFAVVQTMWTIRDGFVAPAMFRHEHPSLFGFTTRGDLVVAIDGFALADPARFSVSRTVMEYGNPFGISALHGLRWLYAMKLAATRGWLAFTEKYGLPILVARIPRDATGGQEAISDLRTAIESLDLTNGLILANGEEIESVARDGGKSGTSHQESFIRYLDSLATRRLQGGELNVASGESVGSYAQSQTHDANTRRRAVELAKMRDAAVNAGPLGTWLRYNFGEDMVGRVEWRTDVELRADSDDSIKRLEAGARLGLPIAASQAREMLGLDAPGDDDEIVEPVASVPATMPAETDDEDSDETESGFSEPVWRRRL